MTAGGSASRSARTVDLSPGPGQGQRGFGVFTAIQFAGKAALDDYYNLTPPIRALYKERRDAFVGACAASAGMFPHPGDLLRLDALAQGTYLAELCTRLLDEADVVTTPGIGFGRPPTATSAPP